MRNEPRYLITGSNGFVGSALAYRTLLRGGRPTLLARPNGAASAEARISARLDMMEAAFGEKVDRSLITFADGDVALPLFGLSNHKAAAVGGKVDAVIHAAALLSFDPARDEEVRRCNVGGTGNVLDFCNLAEVPLHYVSTAFVCGRAEGLVDETRPAAPPQFRNAYERSKWEAEGLVLDAHARGAVRADIYRPSIILGDRFRGFTPIFTTLYRWFLAVDLMRRQRARQMDSGGAVDLDLRFPADPDGVISVVPIDYVADAILHIARTCAPDGRIFHLAARGVPRNAAHLELVMKALGVTGVRLAPAAELAAAGLSAREARLVNAVADYGAYFDCRMGFCDDNTRRALAGSGIEPAEVNQAYVDKIIAYARETDWGRLAPGPPPAGAAVSEREAARGFFLSHLMNYRGRRLLPDLKSLDAIFCVELVDPPAGTFTVRVANAMVADVTEEQESGADHDPAFVFTVPVRVFLDIAAGAEDPREAFFAGKTEIRGDIESALAVIPVLKRFFEEYPYHGRGD